MMMMVPVVIVVLRLLFLNAHCISGRWRNALVPATGVLRACRFF
jgi:hypothetical protein